MADPHGPVAYRPAPGEIPESPGVYRFRDQRGRVIYVGKAKSLRQRLNSYFADFASLHPRTQMMLTTAAGVEWTVVGTEVEALQLEYSWIKEFDPRFNIKYRDDKSYPYLAVTMGEEYPRVMVMRGAKRKGTKYFGPYSHAWAIRDTVDTLLRVFPVRTCSAGVFKRSGQIGRPCLLGYIGKCSAPCVKRISEEDHRALAQDFCDFMAGQTSRFASRLEAEMMQAAREEEYERAARLRDDLRALERAIEKQAVVLGDGTDCDVIALAEDQLEAAVQVFYVRGGRVRGQRGWVLDKIEEVTRAGLVEQFLGQVYADTPADAEAVNAGIPREVLVPELPPDPATMSQWLAERRGGPVILRVPRRGDKKALLETVARNAGQTLALHKTRRASDLTTRSKALSEIQEALGLDDAPLRIECYDVSNLQGTHVVASMVVFEDGLARKSEYRRFAIKGTRRHRRHLRDLRGDHPAVPPLPGRTGEDGRAGHTGRPGPRRGARSRPFGRTDRGNRRRGNLLTRPTWWSSTAARCRPTRRPEPWPSWASTTSPSAGWPSAWRRCGSRARSTRSSCRAAARGCTCCSGCGTRRTGSRSPTIAPSAARPPPPARSTTCPGSARPAARPCSSTSARCVSSAQRAWRRSRRCRASAPGSPPPSRPPWVPIKRGSKHENG